MKKYYIYVKLVIIVLLLSNGLAKAQHPAVHSLYMFDQLMINPAYAGVHVQFSASGHYRNQWVNFPGSPKTGTIAMQSTVAQNKLGLGLVMFKDVIGAHVDLGASMSYSYKLQLPVGNLSMGLSAGFQSLETDFNSLTKRDLNGPLLTGVYKKVNPNFGVGLFYTSKSFFMGASAPYLLNSAVIDAAGILSEASRTRIYYLTIGNTFKLSPDVKVMPSALLRIWERAPISFDLSTNFIFYDAVGFGASYRLIEGLILMTELKVNENFHVGYAYDVTTSEIQRYANGTHEIMLNYRIKIPRLHKGLECPSYF
ncbi:MAG: type IX secretion system membrane protein PorP/SprF [Cyclobacteriaceae bacterium]|nr:type IX secretion system membrane protein PorP/SprF [Cyclobacteriaceae bacterium]